MKSYTIKKFKIVSDLKHLLAEGPIWDHKFNRYLFVDIKKNYFYIFKNNILKKYSFPIFSFSNLSIDEIKIILSLSI